MLPIRSSIPHPAESAPFAPVQLACPITTSVGLLRYAGAHGGNRPRPRLPWRSIRHGCYFAAFLDSLVSLSVTYWTLEFPGDVAQLVRAPDCRSGGCGFEPRRPRCHDRSTFPACLEAFLHLGPMQLCVYRVSMYIPFFPPDAPSKEPSAFRPDPSLRRRCR